MNSPRKSYVGLALTAVVLVTGRLVSPIIDSEIQDFWKDETKPLLVQHAHAWVSAMLDWLGPFWSGFGAALVVMFVFETALLWRRSRASVSSDELEGPDRATTIELGRECIAIADETLRTQQQIDDAAPKPPRPENGYRDQDHWNRVQFNYSCESHDYQIKSMMRRDRAHGADLVDVIFRLREIGLTIPMFADSVAGATDEMTALLLPHYLPAYARFVGTMGRILKRGDLKGAIRSSRDYRRVTERGDSSPTSQPALNRP